MNIMTPREILQAARRGILDPTLWCQYQMYQGDAACSLGWIARSSGWSWGNLLGERFENYGAYCKARDYLREALGIDPLDGFALAVWDIPHWNDADERTHADVVAAFDRAVLLAAKDEGLTEMLEATDGKEVRELVLA